MKITRKDKKFDPIVITITIGSEEERIAIKDMSGLNITIPNLGQIEHKIIVRKFLDKLRDCL